MKTGKGRKLLAVVLCLALLCADVVSFGTTAFAAETEKTYDQETQDSWESAAIEESSAGREAQEDAAEAENTQQETMETVHSGEDKTESETSMEETLEKETLTENKTEQDNTAEETSENESAEETKTEQESMTETASGESDISEEYTGETDTEGTETETEEDTQTEEVLSLSGEGTEDSPYLITTEAELATVAGGLNKVYQLQKDIALSKEWTPICTYTNAFFGTFDGNGHSITGVVINSGVEVHRSGSTSYKGSALFGLNNGTIKNLTIKGTVTGDGDYSAVAVAYNTGTIENVIVQGATVTGKNNVGLLAGYSAGSGTISGCSVTGAATGKGDNVGGFIGDNGGKITDGSADATVSNGVSSGYTGGFAGYNSGNIADSGSTGKTSGSGYTGGFVGRNEEKAAVTNCSAKSTVSSGEYYTGGFAGYNDGSIENSCSSGNVEKSEQYSGGFCGCNTGWLTRCLSEGSVDSTGSYAGGFVGCNEGGTVQYSGSRGAVTSGSGNAGGLCRLCREQERDSELLFDWECCGKLQLCRGLHRVCQRFIDGSVLLLFVRCSELQQHERRVLRREQREDNLHVVLL